MTEKQKHDGAPVAVDKWGKDHFSTLLYIESICVDAGGVPAAEKMRTWGGRPKRGKVRGFPGLDFGGKEYPTRLSGGVELYDHDDWDCVDDMVAVGLIIWNGTGLMPVFEMSPAGRSVAGMLRNHLAETQKSGRRTYQGFDASVAVDFASKTENPPTFPVPS